MTTATLSHPIRSKKSYQTRVIDPTIRLHVLSTDPENTSFGPFEGEDVHVFLRSLMR